MGREYSTMTAYYLVTTIIDHGFTDSTIIAATNAAQALDTMRQLAAPFGYKVQDCTRQLDRIEAAEMAKRTHSIKATKTPRIRNATKDTAQPQQPMRPEQKQELAEALDKIDLEGMECLLQYISFLQVLDQQPRLTF